MSQKDWLVTRVVNLFISAAVNDVIGIGSPTEMTRGRFRMKLLQRCMRFFRQFKVDCRIFGNFAPPGVECTKSPFHGNFGQVTGFSGDWNYFGLAEVKL